MDHKKSYVCGAGNDHQYPINMPQMAIPMQWGGPAIMSHPGQYFPHNSYMMRPRLHDYSQLNHQLAALAMNMHGQYPPHFAMMPPAWQYPQQQAQQQPPQHQTQPLAPFADTFYHNNAAHCQQKKATPSGGEGQSSSNDDETPSGIHPLASGSTSPSTQGSTGNKMPTFNAFSPLSAFCANIFQPYLQSSPLIQVAPQPSSSQGSTKSNNTGKANEDSQETQEKCENEEREEMEEREACDQEIEEKEEAMMTQVPEDEEQEHYFEEPEDYQEEDEECGQYAEEDYEGEYEEEEVNVQQPYDNNVSDLRNNGRRSAQNG